MFVLMLVSFVLVIAGCCNHANAGDVNVSAVNQAGFDKLSNEQQAEIISQVTKLQTAPDTPTTAAKVDEWVAVGDHIGQALGGAAKQLNVAVNEFAKTDVGKMTMMMVIWQYAGSDLMKIALHIVGGFTVLLVGFPMIIFLVRRVNPLTVTYDPVRVNKFGNAVKLSATRDSLEPEYMATFLFSSVVVLGLSILLFVTA